MDPTVKEMEDMARQKMAKNVIEYMPPKVPDADRVRELYYTSNQEGFLTAT